MSKMFILDRSGVNPSMVETPKNSIPVYADKESAEADLTNLSVGQIVATESTHEDDVADLKTYIKNQNILSDAENITIPSNGAANITPLPVDQSYICPYDGYVTFGGTVSSYNIALMVNGIATLSFYGNNGVWTTPVKKGDYLCCSGGFTISTSFARWYKLRDYTGR